MCLTIMTINYGDITVQHYFQKGIISTFPHGPARFVTSNSVTSLINELYWSKSLMISSILYISLVPFIGAVNLVPQEPPYLQYHIGLCNPCKPSFCSTPQSTWQFIASTRWSLLYDRIIMKIGHIGEQGYLCRGIFSVVNRNWNHQSVSRLIVADPTLTGVFFYS